MKQDKSNILLALFKRKGGEGHSTQVIDTSLYNPIDLIFEIIDPSEKPLIKGQNQSGHDYLFTNQRIVIRTDQQKVVVPYAKITGVNSALKENERLGIRAKRQLKIMELEMASQGKILIEVEPGEPYFGLLNMLKYIAGNSDFFLNIE